MKKIIAGLIIVVIGAVLIVQYNLSKIESEIFDKKSNAVVTITKEEQIEKLYFNNKDLFEKVNKFVLSEHEKYNFNAICLPIDSSKDILEIYDIFPRDKNTENLISDINANADIRKLASELKINYIQIQHIVEGKYAILYLQKNVLDNREIGLAYIEDDSLADAWDEIDDNWCVWYTKDQNDGIFRSIYDAIYMN